MRWGRVGSHRTRRAAATWCLDKLLQTQLKVSEIMAVREIMLGLRLLQTTCHNWAKTRHHLSTTVQVRVLKASYSSALTSRAARGKASGETYAGGETWLLPLSLMASATSTRSAKWRRFQLPVRSISLCADRLTSKSSSIPRLITTISWAAPWIDQFRKLMFEDSARCSIISNSIAPSS